MGRLSVQFSDSLPNGTIYFQDPGPTCRRMGMTLWEVVRTPWIYNRTAQNNKVDVDRLAIELGRLL
jgi:hypothetical protein